MSIILVSIKLFSCLTFKNKDPMALTTSLLVFCVLLCIALQQHLALKNWNKFQLPEYAVLSHEDFPISCCSQ